MKPGAQTADNRLAASPTRELAALVESLVHQTPFAMKLFRFGQRGLVLAFVLSHLMAQAQTEPLKTSPAFTTVIGGVPSQSPAAEQKPSTVADNFELRADSAASAVLVSDATVINISGTENTESEPYTLALLVAALAVVIFISQRRRKSIR
jgi:hypothetical protein